MVKLVAILNITPDSFSDGGKFNNIDAALKQAEKLIKDGADIIDIGAESTRPGAKAISYEEEWQRLKDILPKIINLAHKNNIKVSLDSYHSENIKKALNPDPSIKNQFMSSSHAPQGSMKKIRALNKCTRIFSSNLVKHDHEDLNQSFIDGSGLNLGVDIINDVAGFSDNKIINLAAKSAKKIILTHNLGIPACKNTIINENLDEIAEIRKWLENKLNILLKKGIKKENIIFDPGVGFGKNAAQSINIINNIDKFQDFGLDIYVGHSRKSFLKEFEFNQEITDKDKATLEISKLLIDQGAKYLRVHDVLKHRELLNFLNNSIEAN